MMSKLPVKMFRLPFYPWLAGLLPVLHLFSVNFGAVIESEVPLCIFWVAAASTIIYLVAYAVTRSHHRSALIALCVILGFSLSGHIHALLFDREPLSVWTFVVVIVVTLAVAALIKSRDDGAFAQAALPLNLVFLAMLLPQIATLAANYSDAYTNYAPLWNRDGAPAAREQKTRINDSDTRPDVYYIIPDGYPSDVWLREAMDYDNSDFTQALRERGFTIHSQAQSNYGSTLLSLASVLNMAYLDSNPSPYADDDYLRLLIADSETSRRFQRLGYTYIQFMSGYIAPSPSADINRDFTPAGTVDIALLPRDMFAAEMEGAGGIDPREDISAYYKRSFLSLYLDTTLFKIIGGELYQAFASDSKTSYDMYAPERFLDTIDELESVIAMPEATFTTVHLLKPHQPTTFDEHGNIIDAIKRPKPHEFFAELRFVNSKLVDLIDKILQRSAHEPVIILQADHGSILGTPVRDGRKTNFDVYSAYYLPAAYDLAAPTPFTTVNTFPLVFDAVFDGDIELRDNHLIEMSIRELHDKYFDQDDVTESFARW